MEKRQPNLDGEPDEALDAALKQLALGHGDDLADAGFTADVMQRLPAPAVELRRRDLVRLSYLTGISGAAAVSLLGLTEFFRAVAAASWGASPEVWLSVAAPLAIMSWYSMRLSGELIRN